LIFFLKEECFEFLKKQFDVRTRSQAIQLRIAFEAGERELEKNLSNSLFLCEHCHTNHSVSMDRLCKDKERKSFAGQFRNASCSICLEKFLQTSTRNLIVTKCGHFFHRSCSMRNRREGRFNCPYCNQHLTGNLNRLYLN
jgi:hypothetical protein